MTFVFCLLRKEEDEGHVNVRKNLLPHIVAEEGSSICFYGRRFFHMKEILLAEEPSSAATCFIVYYFFILKIIPEPSFYSYY